MAIILPRRLIRKLTYEDRARAVDRLQTGMLPNAFAAIFGVHSSTVVWCFQCECEFKSVTSSFVDVGARISDQTGVCEGLPHSWARNQTIEHGYGYVEKVHVSISYQPQFVVVHEDLWDIPVVLNPRARIDIHMKWEKFKITSLRLEFYDEGVIHSIDFECRGSADVCYAHDYLSRHPGLRIVPDNEFELPHKFKTSDQWKISFVAQRNTLYMLVDDEVVIEKKLAIVRLNDIRSIRVDTSQQTYTPKIRIQSFEFTAA